MIKFPATVNHERWAEVREILDEAAEIARTTRTTRTRDQVFEDARNGLMLQYAVASGLEEAGYFIELAPASDKSYDFAVNGIRIDVKGMFKDTTKYFGQSDWERHNALPSTIYACYDCRSGICEYAGWCAHGDFLQSQYSGYYISPARLKV